MNIGGIDMGDDFKFSYHNSAFSTSSGNLPAAICIAWGRGLDSITVWFDSDDERSKFVDALLAHEMDYRMTKDGTAIKEAQKNGDN